MGAGLDGGDDVVASATATAGSGDDVADVETGQVPVAERVKVADGPAGVGGAA